MMQSIFTATLGRNGSQNLVDIFNRFGIDCFAEHEPPDLPLRQLGFRPFFRKRGWFGPGSKLALLGRNWQRRLFAPDELVGRGEALRWVEEGNTAQLAQLANRRVRRLQRIAARGYLHYLEAGPYFLRTYGHQVFERVPDLGIIKLTRDPLTNAKSFVNRQKDPWKTSLPPDRNGNILRLTDWQKLSEFQLYLHLWFETELKFADFVERHAVKKVFKLKTPDLSDPNRISAMFHYFGIDHRPLKDLRPSNTAQEHGKEATLVTAALVEEYHRFLALVPPALLDRIEFLRDYVPRVA